MLANQGINAGFLGIGSSGREDSSALDVFYDAPEEPVADSFSSAQSGFTNADVGRSGQNAGYGTGQSTSYTGAGYVTTDQTGSSVRSDTGKQPYVNQTGPPVVDTSNDPDDTFGPVKARNQPAQSAADTREARAPASFGDDDNDYEGTGSTPGKKGFRAKMKGKLGSKKEHHQEKKRVKADHELEDKMHQKEIPKTEAVTVHVICASLFHPVCLLQIQHTA